MVDYLYVFQGCFFGWLSFLLNRCCGLLRGGDVGWGSYFVLMMFLLLWFFVGWY